MQFKRAFGDKKKSFTYYWPGAERIPEAVSVFGAGEEQDSPLLEREPSVLVVADRDRHAAALRGDRERRQPRMRRLSNTSLRSSDEKPLSSVLPLCGTVLPA